MKQMKELMPEEAEALLDTISIRFEENMQRHADVEWTNVKKKLVRNPGKMWSLHQMEITGGEPDVVKFNREKDEYVFFDCVAESPGGRRSVCYDQAALDARKKYKPAHSAVGMALEMGVALLTEAEYRELQQLGNFDTKTSSWLHTPKAIREFGGAIFGDWRYGNVFIYHNGAESYYGARGFRCSLRV